MTYIYSRARVVAALALAVSMAVPSLAQDAIPLDDARLAAAADDAEMRGRTLQAYDQAAWHATDALLTDVDPSTVENPRGYVVVPRVGDTLLDTIFVVEVEGQLREFAHYTVDGSQVVSGGPIEGDLPALSPLAERMFEARDPALEAMVAAEYRLYSELTPNTLVLPPDEEDQIAFYLLTSTVEEDSYPIGGHYRADVRNDGTVASTRRYMNTCFDLPKEGAAGPDGDKGRPGISYLLGDTPSEIHVFASFQFPDGLFVITTGNGKLWLVEDGSIALAEEDFGPQ